LKNSKKFLPATQTPVFLHLFGVIIGLVNSWSLDSHICFPSLGKKLFSQVFFVNNDINRSFFLPLSVQISGQLVELQHLIDEREWDQSLNDS
jgi:hypothetical protein